MKGPEAIKCTKWIRGIALCFSFPQSQKNLYTNCKEEYTFLKVSVQKPPLVPSAHKEAGERSFLASSLGEMNPDDYHLCLFFCLQALQFLLLY